MIATWVFSPPEFSVGLGDELEVSAGGQLDYFVRYIQFRSVILFVVFNGKFSYMMSILRIDR